MKKIIYIGILALALSPAAVFAQTAVPGGQNEFGSATNVPTYVLLTPLPCIGATQGSTCTSSGNGASQITSIGIQGYLLYLFKLLIALTVFLAVVMTIFGGFKYMAVESVTGKSDARKTIENAVEGLLLALASYLILYTINPNFVNLSNVAVPKLNVSASSNVQSSIGDLNSSPNQTAIASDAALTSNNAAATQAQANLQTAQNNVDQLQQQVDACGDNGSECDPTTYEALQYQLTDAQQNVTTYSDQATTQSGLAAMNTEVVQSSRILDEADTNSGVVNPAYAQTQVSNNLTTLQTNYDSSLAAITANGNNDPGDIQTLNTQFQYASSTLTDEQVLLQAQANPSSAAAALNTVTAEDSIMASNGSSTLQQQYLAQSSSTKASLQSIKTNYQATQNANSQFNYSSTY